MKRKWVILVLAMFLAAGWAGASSRVGNGGNRVESVFRRQAYQLISDIGNRPAADAVCAAHVMKSALESSEIRLVEELTDRATGRPPEKPNLEAWSVPGEIQLLKEPWEKYLSQQKPSDEGVLILIAHEIYRATGVCDDSTGQISQRLPDLLRLPSRNSITYKFEWYRSLPIEDEDHGLWMDRDWIMDPKEESDFRFSSFACDGGLNLDKVTRDFRPPPRREATCVGIEQGGRLVVFRFAGLRVYDKSTAECWPWWLQVESRRLTPAERTAIENALRFASRERPFYVVFDLDENGLAYGFGLSRLTRIQ